VGDRFVIPAVIAFGLALVIIAVLEYLRLIELGAAVLGKQWRAERATQPFFFRRPFLGRRSSFSVKGVSKSAVPGPDDRSPRTSPRSSHVSSLLLFPLLAIDPSPDYEAVVGGVEIVVFTALLTVAMFMVVGFIRKHLGE